MSCPRKEEFELTVFLLIAPLMSHMYCKVGDFKVGWKNLRFSTKSSLKINWLKKITVYYEYLRKFRMCVLYMYIPVVYCTQFTAHSTQCTVQVYSTQSVLLLWDDYKSTTKLVYMCPYCTGRILSKCTSTNQFTSLSTAYCRTELKTFVLVRQLDSVL